jgi:GDPmannose 4,6-dehydratase
MLKVAIITGVTGQDGSYLSELLLKKGYDVYGLNRRTSTLNTSRIIGILNHPNFTLYQSDLGDYHSMFSVIEKAKRYDCIEIYNLGAQTQVGTSFVQPEYTADVNALGPLRILECIRQLKITDKTRLYQASTSELYGKVVETPQTEETPFYPRSPYGVAKLYAFWIIKNYRESYGMFACNGILFNHESERRGLDFVTRKITSGINTLYKDPTFTIELGNIDAKRDWGHAEDYVNAMWLILQHNIPDDYVIATGETHTVREFIELAFKYAGHSITWSGSGINEIGKDENGRTVVKMNENFYRPAEVDILLGNPSKAQTVLGWTRSITFDKLVERMVKYDLEI